MSARCVARIDHGAAVRPRIPAVIGGDSWMVHSGDWGILLAAIDGLGHGPEAAVAADAALDGITRYRGEPLGDLLVDLDRRLRHTRGAALSLASICGNTLTWVGIGNVEAMLWPAAGGSARYVPQFPGIVGTGLPTFRPGSGRLDPDDLLILATDGIHRRFGDRRPRRAPPQHIADGILREHGLATDDALVLVARYVGSPA